MTTPPPDGSGERPGDPLPDDAYERAACGLLTTAANGTIQRVNGTMCAWTGFSASELVGRRFQDLLTIGSKLFHQTHWMPLMQMQGSVAEVELEMVRRDGRVLPILVNAAQRGAIPPEPTAPRPRQAIDVAVFIATDRRKYERELLSARRQAEALLASEREAQEARARAEDIVRQRELEFRTLAENSPDVIARFDRARRLIYLSPAAERLTERPLHELLGKGVEDVGFTPANAAAWSAVIERAFEGHHATLASTYGARGGRESELQTHVVPERDARGEVATVLCITRDVTPLKQQEREAQQRAVLAEQLIGIVSHDLRNPLNAVLFAVHILRSADLGPNARMVDRITSATQRANRLIEDLLDFTQARLGGGLRVSPRAVDLHEVAAECVDEIKLAWPGRALEHRKSGDGRAVLDPDRLAQVVTNLANNALTYGAPEQPVTITTSASGGDLELAVHNAGRPIPEALMGHIFEPMRRGEGQVRQRGSRSVGLGLYIVREIAAAHGGRVAVRSSEQEGTTFVVTLPREAAPGASLGASGDPA